MLRWIGVLSLHLVACGPGASPQVSDAERRTILAAHEELNRPCEACLAAGRTWQPPDCTDNCDLQDTSCYRDACPGPCTRESCDCETRAACEVVGCLWRIESEAMWCRAP